MTSIKTYVISALAMSVSLAGSAVAGPSNWTKVAACLMSAGLGSAVTYSWQHTTALHAATSDICRKLAGLHTLLMRTHQSDLVAREHTHNTLAKADQLDALHQQVLEIRRDLAWLVNERQQEKEKLLMAQRVRERQKMLNKNTPIFIELGDSVDRSCPF